MALSWFKLRVMDWFCQGLINSLMHGDTIYFVGRCVVEADAPSPTVHLSSTILGGRHSALRGDSLP